MGASVRVCVLGKRAEGLDDAAIPGFRIAINDSVMHHYVVWLIMCLCCRWPGKCFIQAAGSMSAW